MHTQCPECKTKFVVNDDQLRVAHGKVRCSKCNNVFNALNSLHNPTQTSTTIPNLQPKEPPKTTTDFMSEADLEEFADLKAKTLNDLTPENKNNKPAPKPEPVSKIDDDLSDVLEELERIEKIPQDNTKAQQEPSKKPEPNKAKKAKVEDAAKPSAPNATKSSSDPLEKLIPKKPPRKKGGLLWSIAIILLLAIALAQLAWFKREQLMHYPDGRMLLQTACKYAGCSLPTIRAPEKIQVLSRSITVHPKIENALLIQLTIANQARFPQPRPILQISLFNGEELLMAQRRFKPDEYMDDNAISDPLLPGKALYVELVIEDPGDDVTGFKLDFF